MSQRGGDVQSNLRISDKEIASDLIPYGKADLIISVEPMEALRYLPFLSPDGWVITSTKPYINIPEYPEMDKVMDEIRKLPHYIALDADELAKEIGTLKVANIVTLGAASPFLDMRYEKLEDAICSIFRNKGEDVVNKNLQALKAGRDFTERQINP
jgi:indolepyruvate ferredoxin oxidoreductase beta subunit